MKTTSVVLDIYKELRRHNIVRNKRDFSVRFLNRKIDYFSIISNHNYSREIGVSALIYLMYKSHKIVNNDLFDRLSLAVKDISHRNEN